MEFDEKDNEVIKLLTKLKDAEGGYPADLLALRRQGYVKQLAQFGVGMGMGFALKQALKSNGGSFLPPVASTALETALIIAIVLEAGAVAFMNRDKVNELFRTITSQPGVEQVGTPPEISSPIVEQVLPAVVNSTETSTPTGTPSPALVSVTNQIDEEEASSVQSNATPNANQNNGNHYGQTPKPDRTKDSGGNSGGNDPPKPKKESKK